MSNKEESYALGQQFGRAMSALVQKSRLDSSIAAQIPDIYPEWSKDHGVYLVDDIVKWGKNKNNITQIYKVIKQHTSKASLSPDKAVEYFEAIVA